MARNLLIWKGGEEIGKMRACKGRRQSVRADRARKATGYKALENR